MYKNEKKTSRNVRIDSDEPISSAYREIDNDLARDNLENDISEADLQDLR